MVSTKILDALDKTFWAKKIYMHVMVISRLKLDKGQQS
jgi:hypothetical protein